MDGYSAYRGSPRIEDPTVQAEILTEAQILLTAFVVVLKPQPWDQPTSRHSAPVPVKGRVRCLGNGPNQSGADGKSLNEQWSELAFTSEDAVLPFSRIAERMLLFLRTGTGMGLHPASGATVPL